MSAEIARPPCFIDRVARKKLNALESWEHYKWEIVSLDDLLVTGGIARLLKSGKREGRRTWDGKGQTVVVTAAELSAEYLLYESETGNCHKCGGSGRALFSWCAIDGNEYETCQACDGTGKAAGGAA